MRVLAYMEPLLAQDRPHVCGQDTTVPLTRPAPVPKQTVDRELALSTQQPVHGDHVWDNAPRYTLREAWERNLLPWTARTARTYMRQRSAKLIVLSANGAGPILLAGPVP